MTFMRLLSPKQLEIGQKRKRGRPGLAKKGLRRQDSESRYATFESMLVHDPNPEPIAPAPPAKRKPFLKSQPVSSLNVPENNHSFYFCLLFYFYLKFFLLSRIKLNV